jgi:hypothetical protein
MTNISRGMAALTILVVAGFTAGCGSADAPTKAAGPAKKPAVAAPAKTAYCAPLAAAFKVKPPSGQSTSLETMKQYGKLLEPAAAAASAGGNTDVAGFLNLTAKMSADPMHAGDLAQGAFAAAAKAYPVILKDCAIDIMK